MALSFDKRREKHKRTHLPLSFIYVIHFKVNALHYVTLQVFTATHPSDWEEEKKTERKQSHKRADWETERGSSNEKSAALDERKQTHGGSTLINNPPFGYGSPPLRRSGSAVVQRWSPTEVNMLFDTLAFKYDTKDNSEKEPLRGVSDVRRLCWCVHGAMER
ncbi:hypothetical protein EYF80_052981 [Liparis tanakae]|uniref:Uncharacterized protein n=1 Tax=Liparis tanakae TaxID=230148 RepID=A0A4Z2F7R4_9TELE|nr:hypothetical protein EYF80_052981 [Liparis tanakae]